MKRSLGVLGLSAVGVGAAYLAFSRPVAPAVKTPPPVAVAQPVVATAPLPDVKRAPGCQLEVGQRLAYQVGLSSEAKVDLAQSGLVPEGQTLAPMVTSATLEGRLEMQVLSTGETGAVVYARTTALKASASLHPEEMDAPFLIEIDKACGLSRFAWPQSAVMRGARAQQALLWEGNWKDPATGVSEMAAHNGTGAYVASLTVSRDAQGVLVERTHGPYQRLWQHRAEGFSARGTLQVRTGAGPWHERLELQESQETEGQQLSVRLTMRRVPTASAPMVVNIDQSVFVWGDLLPRDFSRREARADNRFDRELRAKVAPLSLDQAISTLTESVKQKVGIERQWPSLSAWLEAHPEHTAEVMKKLSREELPVEAVNAFFIAVGNANTPQAREALLSLKRSEAAPPVIRVRAMFSLIDRDDVDSEFARELASDAQSLTGSSSKEAQFMGNEALLAVTMMAGLKEEPDITEVATEAVRALLNRGNDNAHVERVALKALGNLGDPKLLALAQPASAVVQRRTREAAAKTFRRMKPADSNGFVLGWLARERDVMVRREIYRTLESQHFDLKVVPSEAIARQVLRDLPNETSMMSRKAMLRLLGRSELRDATEVREVLKRQARLESEKGTGLLNEIAEMLTPAEVREVLQ